MYQKILKKKKKQSKKQYYRYQYPVVVNYLFCLMWIVLMQPVRASLNEFDIKWGTWKSMLFTPGNITEDNSEILKKLQSDVNELAATGDLKLICTADNCESLVKKSDFLDYKLKKIDKGILIVIAAPVVRVICPKINICNVTVKDIMKKTDYLLVKYNYNEKKSKKYLDFLHNPEIIKKLETVREELNTEREKLNTINQELSDQKVNVKHLQAQLDELKKSDQEKLTDTSDLKKQLDDATKNCTQLKHSLIALLVVCGFSIIYLLLKKQTPVANANEEENVFDAEKNPVQSKDEIEQNLSESEETKQQSAESTEDEPELSKNDEESLDTSAVSDHSSPDYTPILVCDSYYEEHCTNSQATVTVTEEKITVSSESKNSTIQPQTQDKKTEKSSDAQN